MDVTTEIDTKAQVIALAAKLAKLRNELPWLISVNVTCPAPDVFIREEEMTAFAPLKDWTLNVPRDTNYCPYGHHLMVNGVDVNAITDNPIEVE